MTQSNISMSFATQSNRLVLNNNNQTEFENFWHNNELNYAVTKDTKIISYAYQLSNVDPLACLQNLNQKDTLHFYWENCSKQEAVAAWGVTRSSYTKPNSRFNSAQNFVQSCFDRIVREGESNLAIGKPSVFCSFSFFSEAEDAEPFKSGTLFLPRFGIVKKNKNCCFIVNYPLQDRQDEKQIIEQIEQKAVEVAVAVECIADMALMSLQLEPGLKPIEQELLDKHFLRKHGAGAYYGQPE